MKILLTGSSGFVGNNIAKYLLKQGHHVEGISRKQPTQHYTTYNFDLTDSNSFKKIPSKNNFDCVVHCASLTDESEIDLMFQNNVISTLNILNFCKRKKIKKFILISGHNVYDPNSTNPKNEKSKTIPITNYGLTKLLQENLAKFYAKNNLINVCILRLSYVYGLNQPSQKLIPSLIKKYLKSENIELHKYKNGFQKLDLINVHDVCMSVEKSLTVDSNFDIFNISYGRSVTVKDILKILKQIVYSDSKISINDIKQKIPHYEYDNSHAKKKLNFSPTITLFDGIDELVKNFT